MSEPWKDKGDLGLVFAYSQWLDAQGLVISDQTPGDDTRTHAELAEAFMAERAETERDARITHEDAAKIVESLRVHVDNNPHSTCPDGCGWFNYAAMKLRGAGK